MDQGPGAVLPGVALTWGSAFLCAGAPDAGTCEITVAVLAATDEGRKATLHLLAHGHDVASGGPVDLGINLHLRAPGVQT